MVYSDEDSGSQDSMGEVMEVESVEKNEECVEKEGAEEVEEHIHVDKEKERDGEALGKVL